MPLSQTTMFQLSINFEGWGGRVICPTTFVKDLNQEMPANKESDSKATELMAMLLGLVSSLPPAQA